MHTHLALVALLVDEYDRAIAYFTRALGFSLVEDTTLSETKRWVIVKPQGDGNCGILLARAVGDKQLAAIGNQHGGRVGFFLHTDKFEREYSHLIAHQVTIVRPPEDQPHGRVCVFKDLYGNLWDLIQPNPAYAPSQPKR